jgi:hypothetical protein
MRSAKIFPLIAAAFCATALHAQQDDVVMKAMHDEMDRSMKQLTIGSLEKPYFISYRVVDSETTSVAASFGALNRSNSGRSRMLTVEVRTGDYKEDNSHFFTFNMDMGNSMQLWNGMTSLTVENDYKELRRQLWLATDSVYKKAVEDLSKKRASLQNRSRTDDSADFSKEAPAVTTSQLPPVKIDVPKWESEARALSALFRQMPAIHTSTITFFANNSYTRFLTSEGTSYTRREPTVTFNVSAATQADDGAPIDDFIWLHARSQADLPSQDQLAEQIRGLGKYLTEVRDAPTLTNYSGPVLVENNAADQVFRLNFLANLIGTKRTISGMPGGMGPNANQAENPFLDRVGARVLPEFLSVTDNPTISDYQGHHMAGESKMDDDGMPTREVHLIENGVLKSLLMSRDPVRGFDHTTGSRHAGQAAPTNFIVTSSSSVSAADLRAKFIDMIKQRNKPFGIVVRRLRNAGNVELAYKVFPDGHEELVRSLQFVALNAAAFKDIVAVSKEMNFLTVSYRPPNNQVMFTGADSEESFTPVSLAVPSLLFEDATMRKIRAASPNPPVAGHPFFDK